VGGGLFTLTRVDFLIESLIPFESSLRYNDIDGSTLGNGLLSGLDKFGAGAANWLPSELHICIECNL
jgi:hypothetical protein